MRVSGPGMVRVMVEIDDAAAARIATAVGGDAAEAHAAFAKWAIEELAAWISGERRFRTLSEQYIAWVEALHDDVLPTSEAPSFDRLYNNFNMTHGQAAYVTRALSDKRLAQWRIAALAAVTRQLEAKRSDAQGFVDRHEPNRAVTLRTSRLGGIELVRLGNEMFAANNAMAPPEPKGSSGDVRTFSIEAQTVLELLRHLTAGAGP